MGESMWRLFPRAFLLTVMIMKLLKLPLVVLREVFSCMNYKEVFQFSFCSKQSFYRIKSLQLVRFRNIKFVQFMFTQEQIDVTIMPKNGDPRLRFEHILSVKPEDTEWKTFVQTEMAGNKMKFRRQTADDKLVAVYGCKSQMKSIRSAIYAHVCNLFGNDVEYRMRHDLFHEDQSKPIHKNIKVSRIWVQNRTVRDLDDHFSSLPKQKFINICMRNMKGRLKEN
ncbi:hypothetical protein CRE_26156 [Caenorhabditis remanei]|uniref:Uncharacterized protein n=1 Tax=Caenorhabditis remanei TaxID=31234 RepID=E3LQH6_CAERE|nr:hypothetical protein CRE_26156 [Caenorhabditis remanei]